MKQVIRTMLGVTLGLAALLVGQLAIENSAWWVTGGTSTFDDPVFNAIKFSIAGTVGLALGLMIGLPPRRRRGRL